MAFPELSPRPITALTAFRSPEESLVIMTSSGEKTRMILLPETVPQGIRRNPRGSAAGLISQSCRKISLSQTMTGFPEK